MSRRVEIYMDSDYRFEEDHDQYPFWQLPHDEDGFNVLEATLNHDGLVYYKGTALFKITEFIEHAHFCGVDDGESQYTLFLTETEQLDDNGITYWIRDPIIFDNHPITNTHITLYISALSQPIN